MPARGIPRRLGLLVAPAVSLLITAACDRSSETVPRGHAVSPNSLLVVIGPTEDTPEWPALRGGVARYLRDLTNPRCVFLTPATGAPEALRATVDDALRRDPSVICLCLPDGDQAGDAIGRIVAKSIPLITFGNREADERVNGHVTPDWGGGVDLLARQMPRLVGAGRGYLWLHADGRDSQASYHRQRFLSAMQKQAGATLLEEQSVIPVDADRLTGPTPANAADRAAEQVRDLLTRFRSATLVVTFDGEPWLSAHPAWLAQLRQIAPDYRFATFSSAPVLWPLLQSTDQREYAAALVGPLTGQIGYEAARMAIEVLMGLVPSPKSRSVPVELVLPDTLADFARRYAEAADGLDVSTFLRSVTSAPSPRPATRP